MFLSVAKWNSWIIHCFSLNSFSGMSALLFIVAAPVCIPASSVGGLSVDNNFVFSCLFDNSHFSEVIAHCSLDLHFAK